MSLELDTIAAIATPPGRGGVGIVRVSGSQSLKIIEGITGKVPVPRQAIFTPFFAADKTKFDEGLVIFFQNPKSFTGEDVVEFHGHGGPIVLDFLLTEVVKLGARLARPGEFSERAFLNGKIDLIQAEAIADLIASGSRQAATAALNSLQGVFSEKINELLTALIQLRMYVEAAIDFAEEEIDFLTDNHVIDSLKELIEKVDAVLAEAMQGKLLQEGMSVVIIGKPNAGKSSLLNSLSGSDVAIVTDIPGTTRDVLREFIHIDGMPLHIIDTAGLRESLDKVEQEGIKRAHQEVAKADYVLLVIDSIDTDIEDIHLEQFPQEILTKPITIILNKIDIKKENPKFVEVNDKQENKIGLAKNIIQLSAKTGEGVDLLKQALKKHMGYNVGEEGKFMARRRHLGSLERAKKYLITGLSQLQTHKALELLAEDLRQAQLALSEITGEFTTDDLLDEIFSSFCIGK